MKPVARLATLLLLATAAWAANVTREDAAAIAQRASGGRVLSVDRSDAGSRQVWRVKVLTPRGEVRIILVDATTGRPE